MLSPRTSPGVTEASGPAPLSGPPAVHTGDADADLVAGLKRRDEAAFVTLVERYQGPLLRLALVYCRSRDIAEEVVQDAWLGVLKGIDRFEGKAAFRTWLFRILVNRARTNAGREGRTLSFSSLEDEAGSPGEPAVSPERFRPADDKWPHNWAVPPRSWGESADAKLLSSETMELVKRAIDALPPAQQQVITLRDIEGLTAEDVCNVLTISETNQRVLLHRARSRVRAQLERHFSDG